MPRPFGQLDAVILSSFPDVRESKVSLIIRNADNLVEARDRAAYVLCVSQRFFALAREGENAIRQITLRRKVPMFGVGFPSRLHLRPTLLQFWSSLQLSNYFRKKFNGTLSNPILSVLDTREGRGGS